MALGRQAKAVHGVVCAFTGGALALLMLLATVASASAQEVASLTPALLSSYVASTEAATLHPDQDIAFHPEKWLEPEKPALNSEVLSAYAATKFVPTKERVETSRNERLCLAQAIYYEARGEPQDGQWAVANVVLNRVASKRYPSTICGVVFQNADGPKFQCQFTFACDGRSDMGGKGNRIVRESWVRANVIALAAYRKYQSGQHLDTLPGNALYYHTRSVNPLWSSAYKVVAQIGSHIFYSPS